MNLYTIYNSPSDYPDTYVARRFEITDKSKEPIPREIFMIDTDLEKIREKLYLMGLFHIPRHKEDDKNIIETWI